MYSWESIVAIWRAYAFAKNYWYFPFMGLAEPERIGYSFAI